MTKKFINCLIQYERIGLGVRNGQIRIDPHPFDRISGQTDEEKFHPLSNPFRADRIRINPPDIRYPAK